MDSAHLPLSSIPLPEAPAPAACAPAPACAIAAIAAAAPSATSEAVLLSLPARPAHSLPATARAEEGGGAKGRKDVYPIGGIHSAAAGHDAGGRRRPPE